MSSNSSWLLPQLTFLCANISWAMVHGGPLSAEDSFLIFALIYNSSTSPNISPLQSVSNISSPPTSTSSTMPPESSKAAGAEALKKDTAQPIGNFFKAQKKAG